MSTKMQARNYLQRSPTLSPEDQLTLRWVLIGGIAGVMGVLTLMVLGSQRWLAEQFKSDLTGMAE